MKILLKRSLLLLISLAMIALTVPVVVTAEGEGWDGTTITKTTTGTGTAADPYEISTPENLAWLANRVKTDNCRGEFYKLTANIDLNGKSWAPIGEVGNTNAYFRGSFDGNGYTVSNFTVTNTATTQYAAGLFGQIAQATIMNLTVSGATISATALPTSISNSTTCYTNVGSIVGFATKGSLIVNCHSVDNDLYGYVVGGIVGFAKVGGNEPSQIISCTTDSNTTINNNTTWTSSTLKYFLFNGGIVGWSNGAWIIACVNNASLSPQVGSGAGSSNNRFVGGIAGALDWLDVGNSSIDYCINTGTLSGLYAQGAINGVGAWTSGNTATVNHCASTSTNTTVFGLQKNGTTTSTNFVTGVTTDTVLAKLDEADGCDTSKYFVTSLTPLANAGFNHWYSTDTIELASAADVTMFAAFSNMGNAFAGKTVKLTADIMLNADPFQLPISQSLTNAFAGTFDGDGKTLSNVSVSGTTYAGLFGYVNGATIKNLNVSVTSISGSTRAGGIVGQVNNSATITNCHVTTVDATSVIEAPNAGGIVGRTASTTTDTLTISNCSNACPVSAIDNTTQNIGGIIGTSIGASIENCYNFATVTSFDYTGTTTCNVYIGGIMGYAATNATEIAWCGNYGDVKMVSTETANYAGGIAGRINPGSCGIANCFNVGTLPTINTVGEILGYTGANITIANCGEDVVGEVATDKTVTYTNETLIDLKGWQTFEGDATQVRIIAGMGDGTGDVDLTAYDSVGFQIILLRKSDDAHGSYTTEPLTTVYTSVKAGDSTLSASSLNADYIVALTVTGLTDVADGYIFAITPYYTLNGSTDAVYCQTKTLTYVNAEDVISGN